MRTAQVCPTCATYVNAICVIYDGEILSNINVSPLDPLDEILVNIDTTIGDINTEITYINNDISDINNTIDGLYPLFGTEDPTQNSSFIGQTYINTSTGQMFFSTSTGSGTNWQAVCNCNPIGSRIFDQTFDLTFN